MLYDSHKNCIIRFPPNQYVPATQRAKGHIIPALPAFKKISFLQNHTQEYYPQDKIKQWFFFHFIFLADPEVPYSYLPHHKLPHHY